jgi:hypothetical protein
VAAAAAPTAVKNDGRLISYSSCLPLMTRWVIACPQARLASAANARLTRFYCDG